MTKKPRSLEKRAMNEFPYNWAQGTDLNAPYRTGYVVGAEAAIDMAETLVVELAAGVRAFGGEVTALDLIRLAKRIRRLRK